MRKKQSPLPENYLERRPERVDKIKWTVGNDSMVTLETKNVGLANRLAQLLLGKPKVSYIHLDRLGSSVWSVLDGKKTIIQIGEAVETKFGEEAYPLYERLARYFQILEGYELIRWSEE